MIIHVIYLSLVILVCILSLLILGPGSVITLAFLIGIVTIPLAFIIATIPLIGLTLFLSLPFYLVLALAWPTRPAKTILGSIALALILSAGTSFASRIYLANASQHLISSDFNHTVDVHDKHVLVANSLNQNDCRRLCEELILFGSAKAVTLSDEAFDNAIIDERLGATFGLARQGQTGCNRMSSNKTREANRLKKADEDLCIKKLENGKISPDLLITRRLNVSQFDTDKFGAFNPFENAITAKRLLLFDLSSGNPIKKIQYTSVKYFPPFPVLWPFAISKGPHSGGDRGLYRLSIETKKAPDISTLLFDTGFQDNEEH